MITLCLIPLEKNGTVQCDWAIPSEIQEHFPASALWYQKVGYEPPWIGYVAFYGDQCVGSCGFKTPPKSGEVEIAYGTAKPHQGKGYGTSMARALIKLARETDPQIVVTAQTLPHESPSTKLLRKLGFICTGDVNHPEDGTVWEWTREWRNGRRARLRIWSRKGWRFKSSLAHHPIQVQLSSTSSSSPRPFNGAAAVPLSRCRCVRCRSRPLVCKPRDRVSSIPRDLSPASGRPCADHRVSRNTTSSIPQRIH